MALKLLCFLAENGMNILSLLDDSGRFPNAFHRFFCWTLPRHKGIQCLGGGGSFFGLQKALFHIFYDRVQGRVGSIKERCC